MAQQSGIPSPSSNDGDIAEQRYRKKFLDKRFEFTFEWDEENVSGFARFYFKNPKAGYAFHKLKSIFKKIDVFISIKSAMVSTSP